VSAVKAALQSFTASQRPPLGVPIRPGSRESQGRKQYISVIQRLNDVSDATSYVMPSRAARAHAQVAAEMKIKRKTKIIDFFVLIVGVSELPKLTKF
jgi:hypothetical protein